MFYINTTPWKKQFHGVTFQPGETKEVSEFINYPGMVRVSAPSKTHKPAAPKSELKNKEENSDGSNNNK